MEAFNRSFLSGNEIVYDPVVQLLESGLNPPLNLLEVPQFPDVLIVCGILHIPVALCFPCSSPRKVARFLDFGRAFDDISFDF